MGEEYVRARIFSQTNRLRENLEKVRQDFSPQAVQMRLEMVGMPKVGDLGRSSARKSILSRRPRFLVAEHDRKGLFPEEEKNPLEEVVVETKEAGGHPSGEQTGVRSVIGGHEEASPTKIMEVDAGGDEISPCNPPPREKEKMVPPPPLQTSQTSNTPRTKTL